MKKIFELLVVVVVLVIGFNVSVNAAVVLEVSNPVDMMSADVTYFSGPSLYLQEEGVSSPVVGVAPEVYTLLFFVGNELAGYLWTDNLYNNSGYLPILDGNYESDFEGFTPDAVLAFHNPNGGHFADLYDDGSLVFNVGITSFWVSGDLSDTPPDSGSILYNDVFDDILNMEFNSDVNGNITLAPMSVPEPTAFLLFGFGFFFIKKRINRFNK